MALADAEGMPLAISIADGSRHDVVLVDQTLDAALTRFLPPILIGDRAFDSRGLAERLSEERGVILIAPKRGGIRQSRRKQDHRRLRRYRHRWRVERLFAWLKKFRRIATRWDRKAENFLGFIQLACSIIILRALSS
jgi:transposase